MAAGGQPHLTNPNGQLAEDLRENEQGPREEAPSNQPFHRIAARERILLNMKEYDWAANGDR